MPRYELVERTSNKFCVVAGEVVKPALLSTLDLSRGTLVDEEEREDAGDADWAREATFRYTVVGE